MVTVAVRTGTAVDRRERVLMAARAGGEARPPAAAGRVDPLQAPLRIGEQPRGGMPKYRAFDLRRRRAQIAARHVLGARL